MSQNKNSVIVIEDEIDIAELIKFNLSADGHEVNTYNSGEDGLAAVLSHRPDLVLLDLMLPGMSGKNICQVLRKNDKTQDIPIIMVTAKGEESDIVQGLEMGADDYITKPFTPSILKARVNSVLRRSNRAPVENTEESFEVGKLSFHLGRHEVQLEGEELTLTVSEFDILEFLARRPGWVFTRQQIVDAVRGENYSVTDRSIDVVIVGLRKKLGESGSYIETVRGVGYRFKDLSQES